MKRYLFVFMFAFIFRLAFAATGENVQVTSTSINIEGTYNTSAFPGNYLLLDYNTFPMKSDVVGVYLNTLPEGFHYSWTPVHGAEKVRTFKFVYQKNFLGPTGHRID